MKCFPSLIFLLRHLFSKHDAVCVWAPDTWKDFTSSPLSALRISMKGKLLPAFPFANLSAFKSITKAQWRKRNDGSFEIQESQGCTSSYSFLAASQTLSVTDHKRLTLKAKGKLFSAQADVPQAEKRAQCDLRLSSYYLLHMSNAKQKFRLRYFWAQKNPFYAISKGADQGCFIETFATCCQTQLSADLRVKKDYLRWWSFGLSSEWSER